MGLSEFFVGLILVPIIGNAAEHSSAIMMAMRNRMDLAINIAIGSSIQVALLIAPVLVSSGSGIRPAEWTWRSAPWRWRASRCRLPSPSSVIRDAESNWLEGVFLLLAYAILGIAFFFF